MKIIGSLIRAIIFTAVTLFFGGYAVSEILSFTSDQICPAGEKAILDPQATSVFKLSEFSATALCQSPDGSTMQADPKKAFQAVALTYGLGYFLVLLFFSQFSAKSSGTTLATSPSNPAQMAQFVSNINESDRKSIEGLVRQGRTIDAIKKIREVSALDLTSAKGLADQLKSGGGVFSVTSVATPIAAADFQAMKNNSVLTSNSEDGVEERLTKLQQLFDKKLITQEEYNSRRKEILEEI